MPTSHPSGRVAVLSVVGQVTRQSHHRVTAHHGTLSSRKACPCRRTEGMRLLLRQQIVGDTESPKSQQSKVHRLGPYRYQLASLGNHRVLIYPSVQPVSKKILSSHSGNSHWVRFTVTLSRAHYGGSEHRGTGITYQVSLPYLGIVQ